MTNEEFQKIVLEKFNSLEAGQQQLTEKVSTLEKTVNAIHEQTVNLTEFKGETKENFTKLSNKVDGIENKLDDIEVSNADRHLTIIKDLKNIKSNILKIEIVAADNWGDIAKLKAK